VEHQDRTAFLEVDVEYFNEWRVADRAASAFERELTRRSLDSSSTRVRVTQQELDEAKQLRGVATDLFHLVMEQIEVERVRLRRG
jgi:hypothetical protein